MALGVIHGLQDNGLKVPEDVAVVGFDNTRLATMVRPTLTTVMQPMYDIGAVSMRLLTKLLQGRKSSRKASHFTSPNHRKRLNKIKLMPIIVNRDR